MYYLITPILIRKIILKTDNKLESNTLFNLTKKLYLIVYLHFYNQIYHQSSQQLK